MGKNLAPSLLSANFYNLENDLLILKKNDIKYLHLDVMDGVFVPNISFGIPVIKKIKEYTKSDFILDTHLMIIDPIKYIDSFKKAGSDIITIHAESQSNIKDTIKKIKEVGLMAGISINPSTKVERIYEILPLVDLVLVMSVEPGFAGQKFIESTLDKVSELKEIKSSKSYNYIIELDGGVNSDNINSIIDKGADLLVAGSAIFNGDIENNIKLLNKFI